MPAAQPTMDITSALNAAVRADSPDQQPPSVGEIARRASQGDAGTVRFAGGVLGEFQSTPSLPISGGVAQGASAWQNTKKVDALWTNNQDRNSWVGIAGIGWKKLAGPNETAITGMTMLVAHARATGSSINYRDESDNLIHEVYVW